MADLVPEAPFLGQVKDSVEADPRQDRRSSPPTQKYVCCRSLSTLLHTRHVLLGALVLLALELTVMCTRQSLAVKRDVRRLEKHTQELQMNLTRLYSARRLQRLKLLKVKTHTRHCQAHHAIFSQDARKLEAQNAELRANISSVNEERSRTQTELSARYHQLRAMSSRLELMEDRTSNLRGNLSEARANMSALDEAMDTRYRKWRGVHEEAYKLQDQNAALHRSISAAEQACHDSEHKVAKLTTERAFISQELMGNKRQFQHLQERMKPLEEENVALRTTISNLKEEAANSSQDDEGGPSDFDSIKADVEALKLRHASLMASLAKLENSEQQHERRQQ